MLCRDDDLLPRHSLNSDHVYCFSSSEVKGHLLCVAQPNADVQVTHHAEFLNSLE